MVETAFLIVIVILIGNLRIIKLYRTASEINNHQNKKTVFQTFTFM